MARLGIRLSRTGKVIFVLWGNGGVFIFLMEKIIVQMIEQMQFEQFFNSRNILS
jgi:hypothetical protein